MEIASTIHSLSLSVRDVGEVLFLVKGTMNARTGNIWFWTKWDLFFPQNLIGLEYESS